MASKLKPSSKEYIRDKNNKMTNRWFIKHFTDSGASNEDLFKAFSSTPRKRNVIKKELIRRGADITNI